MTDWEARYGAGDTPWDKERAAPPLREIDAACFHGRVLVPGCGFGHDVRAISRPDNTVTGLDLAATAVEKAKTWPRTGNEEYICGDLFALPAAWLGTFSAVFEHTCFCAIDPADRGRYVASVAAALQPGGMLVAIFYINPGHEVGPPFAVSERELDALLDPQFSLGKAWIPQESFPGREGREQVRLYRLRK